jgi:hypothetical protein
MLLLVLSGQILPGLTHPLLFAAQAAVPTPATGRDSAVHPPRIGKKM